MNEAQQAAFQQIAELMQEHFEAGVFIVEAELDDKTSAVESSWHGGYATAIGLLEIGKLRVWDKRADQ